MECCMGHDVTSIVFDKVNSRSAKNLYRKLLIELSVSQLSVGQFSPENLKVMMCSFSKQSTQMLYSVTQSEQFPGLSVVKVKHFIYTL